MGVDETRHHHTAVRVDRTGVQLPEVATDRRDAVVLDQHRPPLQLADRRVHREDVAVDDRDARGHGFPSPGAGLRRPDPRRAGGTLEDRRSPRQRNAVARRTYLMLWSRRVRAPLTNVRVVEFGQLIAGPLVGTLLGDFGAEVIKVEPPRVTRCATGVRSATADRTLWWSVLARNKRSVALDLKDQEAAALALELAAGADVVVENFRPGAMERWGLGPEEVLAANPGCIYARVSGYGQDSRYSDRPGFASGGEAISGLRYINGYPGQAPPRGGISLGDSLAAWSAFQGILLALYARDTAGAGGQVVDAAILDACFAMTESLVPDYALGGVVREPSGSRLPRIAPSNVYRSSDDRWVVIAANHDPLWRRLAAAMGRPELAEDPRYVDPRRPRRAPGRARRADRRLGGRAHRRRTRRAARRRRSRLRSCQQRRRHPRRPPLP